MTPERIRERKKAKLVRSLSRFLPNSEFRLSKDGRFIEERYRIGPWRSWERWEVELTDDFVDDPGKPRFRGKGLKVALQDSETPESP